MKFTLVRHATSVLEYGGQRLLIDPVLAPPQPGSEPHHTIPLVPVPESAREAMASIDAVLASHLHPDHFDAVAAESLARALPVFAQPEDLAQLTAWGFVDVRPVETSVRYEGITITRTVAEHGHGEAKVVFAPASGFVLQADGEPTIYIVGDSVWCEPVRETMVTFRPDVIVVNGGAAQAAGFGPITMPASDIGRVRRAAPEAAIVVVHVDAFPHTTESRADIEGWLGAHGLGDGVVLPQDGEAIVVGTRDQAISRR